MAANNPSPTKITIASPDPVKLRIGGKIVVILGEKTSVMEHLSTTDEILACREHAMIEHGERVVLISSINYSCGTCEKSFAAGFRARETHCDRKSHARPAYECDTCPQFFLTEDARQAHMTATNHFLYVCDFCDLAFPYEFELSDHGRDAHRMEVSECMVCAKVFADDKALVSHENTKHHYCDVCGHQFQTMDALQKHFGPGKKCLLDESG